MMKKTKILFSYNDWNANKKRRKEDACGAIGYYRVVEPARHTKGHDVEIIGRKLSNFGKTHGEAWRNVFKDFDIFWTHYFIQGNNAGAMFYTAQNMGKKIVVDIDDNYLDVPKSNDLHDKYKKGQYDRAILSTILFFADVVVVSTEPLKQRLLEHFREVDGVEKKIVVIPNMNDQSIWQYPKAELHKDKYVIGYAGSNSHKDDLFMVLPQIVEVMKNYPQVHLEIMGAIRKDDLDSYFKDMPQEFRNRIDMIGSTETYGEYPQWLCEQKWNVGICPLVDTPFTRCKSHIKFMEYTSAGKPVIASRVYPYITDIDGRKVITDGETGILCKQNEWVQKLSYLIENPEVGIDMQKRALKHVQENWQYNDEYITNKVNEVIKLSGIQEDK